MSTVPTDPIPAPAVAPRERHIQCWLLWCTWYYTWDTEDDAPLTERQQIFIRDQHVRTCHTEADIVTEIAFLGDEIATYGHLPGVAERVPHLRTRRDNLMRLHGLPGRRPWKPSDGDARCQWCGGRNPVWVVDSAIWNSVMGTGPTVEAPGILCPSCFLIQAAARAVDEGGVWELIWHPREEL